MYNHNEPQWDKAVGVDLSELGKKLSPFLPRLHEIANENIKLSEVIEKLEDFLKIEELSSKEKSVVLIWLIEYWEEIAFSQSTRQKKEVKVSTIPGGIMIASSFFMLGVAYINANWIAFIPWLLLFGSGIAPIFLSKSKNFL